MEYFFAGFEELCKRREELQKQIQQDENERAKLQREINVLSDKLAQVNEGLQKKLATRSEYDRTIAESEAAYMKVCSLNLLSMLFSDFGKLTDFVNCFKTRRTKYSPASNDEKRFLLSRPCGPE